MLHPTQLHSKWIPTQIINNWLSFYIISVCYGGVQTKRSQSPPQDPISKNVIIISKSCLYIMARYSFAQIHNVCLFKKVNPGVDIENQFFSDPTSKGYQSMSHFASHSFE